MQSAPGSAQRDPGPGTPGSNSNNVNSPSARVQPNYFLSLLARRPQIEQSAASAQNASSSSQKRSQAWRFLRQHIREQALADIRPTNRSLAILGQLTSWAQDRDASALPIWPDLVALFIHDLAKQDPQKQDLAIHDLSPENALNHYSLSPNQRRTLIKDIESLREASASFFPNVPEAQIPLNDHLPIRDLCQPVPSLDLPQVFKKHARRSARARLS